MANIFWIDSNREEGIKKIRETTINNLIEDGHEVKYVNRLNEENVKTAKSEKFDVILASNKLTGNCPEEKIGSEEGGLYFLAQTAKEDSISKGAHRILYSSWSQKKIREYVIIYDEDYNIIKGRYHFISKRVSQEVLETKIRKWIK